MNDKCAVISCPNFVKRKGKKYCSTKCYNDAKSIWHMMPCEFCGVSFEGVPGKSKYCTKACSNSATKRSRVGLKCENCDKSFEVVAGRSKTARYCSYECFLETVRDGLGATVEVACENCGKKRDVQFIHRFKRFCNHSCATSGEFNAMHGVTGKDHPMYGRPAWNRGLTTETDERVFGLGKKISELSKRQFASGERSNSGENNPNYGRTRDTRTPEQLENYSKAAIERLKHGGGYVQGYHTSSKTGDSSYYRSSYELRLMKYLDVEPDVIDWVYEPFPIKLEEGRRYLPDFLVTYSDGRKELIEVKPESFLEDVIVVEKGDAARKFCGELGILYRMCILKDIEEMEASLV